MKIEFRPIKSPPENNEQKRTIVFVDYEYLYISFSKEYSIPPMLNEIFDELKQNGKIMKTYVFGDFTKPELNQERNRVRTMTSNIIDCGNEQNERKDFTDFIMLDTIYQELIQNPSVEQFIFFTGDGHFSSVSTFLKNYMDKTVGVYGILGSLSRQLRECSTWVKELRAVEEPTLTYQVNLLKNLKSLESRGKVGTFMRTVEFTMRSYGGDLYRYENALSELIDDGYVENTLCDSFADRPAFKILSVNWDKVKNELGVNI